MRSCNFHWQKCRAPEAPRLKAPFLVCCAIQYSDGAQQALLKHPYFKNGWANSSKLFDSKLETTEYMFNVVVVPYNVRGANIMLRHAQ